MLDWPSKFLTMSIFCVSEKRRDGPNGMWLLKDLKFDLKSVQFYFFFLFSLEIVSLAVDSSPSIFSLFIWKAGHLYTYSICWHPLMLTCTQPVRHTHMCTRLPLSHIHTEPLKHTCNGSPQTLPDVCSAARPCTDLCGAVRANKGQDGHASSTRDTCSLRMSLAQVLQLDLHTPDRAIQLQWQLFCL